MIQGGGGRETHPAHYSRVSRLGAAAHLLLGLKPKQIWTVYRAGGGDGAGGQSKLWEEGGKAGQADFEGQVTGWLRHTTARKPTKVEH